MRNTIRSRIRVILEVELIISCRKIIRSRIRVILEVELIISCRKIIRSRIRVILEVNNFELLIDIKIRDALQVRAW